MRNLFTLLAVIFVSLTFAQDRMTPELLWDLKRVGGPQVSPDGKKLMYSIRKYDLKNNKSSSDLFVGELGLPAKQITHSAATEANALWSNDGQKIYYLAAADEGMNVFEMSWYGKDVKQVSFVKGGMNGFKISPDGKRLLYIADVKMNKVSGSEYHPDMDKSDVRIYDNLMYRHWGSWEDGLRSHIFVADIVEGKVSDAGIDIMEGEDFDSPLMPFGGMEEITFSPDSKKIVYVCKKKVGRDYAVSTNSDLYQYDIISGKTINLTPDNKGYDNSPIFSPDGRKLAWLQMKEDGFEADKNDIIEMDLESGETTNLTKDMDITVSAFAWGPKSDYIYYRSSTEATYQVYEYHIKSMKSRQVTDGIHNITSFEVVGDKIVAGKQSMNHPTDLYMYDIKSGKETQLTDANKEIYDKLKIGKVEKRWVATTDNKKELVWVIFPPDFDETKKYPALLYCQGGPQSTVSQFFSYRWNFQLMAANDYIIIAPNRRGLPGFGQEWNDAISGDWGGQPMDDYLSAVDEIKKEPYIDESNIGAIGASYGGYSVYYLAGIHEKRFKTFISHCGLYNLESWYGTTEELFFANKDIGGSYYGEKIPENYIKNSPHRNAHKWDTPMLIFHGERDYRVPLNQGMEAFQVLQLKGIDSKLITFPDENHWVLSPQNGVIWHREFYSWLDKHLK
ncbi:S9 family peptidase [Paracrocinitomix mangrovi]|uniref:S9 family peptidase n=1 Tax=Paracrocinitomix mangrovi TaxID=2862509 RepID=UPI001C8F1CC3|nr:S9 family peptidase [Paracrocinitomix mangrovi]UKN03363.1 S9 family peptidase [Paracrocinitomix mangrovi]